MSTELDKSFIETEQEQPEVGTAAYFVWRVEQELKRAERYSSFVSLVTFECIPVSHSWDEGLKEKVTEVLASSVRETDIVGVSDACRMALLLVETPRRGAERAAERVAAQLIDICLKEKGKSKLEIKILSFPEDPQGRENFLAAVESLR